MSSRKPPKSQRKLEQKKRKRRERLKRKFEREPSAGGGEMLMQVSPDGEELLLIDPPGFEKMSVVIEEFFQPYLVPGMSVDDIRRLVGVAALAWNAALMPPDTRKAMIDDIVTNSLPGASGRERTEFRQVIEEMIDRKHRYFAHHDRAVLEYVVTDTGKSFHLSIVSTMGGLPPE